MIACIISEGLRVAFHRNNGRTAFLESQSNRGDTQLNLAVDIGVNGDGVRRRVRRIEATNEELRLHQVL